MNKRIVAVAVVLLVAGIWAPLTLALDPMGPPAAGLGKGMWGVGVNYSYSGRMEFERIPTSWSSADRDVKTKPQKLFADLGYGVSDNVDAFARMGIASMTWDKIGGSDRLPEGTDGKWNLAWGGGVKMTLCESADISWGMLAQFSESLLTGTEKASDGDKTKFKVNLDEIQLAVGPTWKASEKVKIYGGPFIQLIRGKWQDRVDEWKPEKPIKEESWLGGYIGAAIEIASNTGLNVEYQYTNSAWAVAGGVCWKF